MVSTRRCPPSRNEWQASFSLLCLDAELPFDVIHTIEFLPSEQFNVDALRFMVAAGKGFLHHLRPQSHVSVGCGF